MRKYFLVCVAVAFALLATACQFSTYFAVVNSSNSQMEVSYELKPSGMMPNENIRNPRILSIAEFDNNKFEWRELPPNRFEVDKEKGIVKAQVEPNEVLQIEDEDSYYVAKEPNEHFDVKKLNLKGINGSVTYEGNQIFKQFQKEEKGWFGFGGTIYVIYYK